MANLDEEDIGKITEGEKYHDMGGVLLNGSFHDQEQFILSRYVATDLS